MSQWKISPPASLRIGSRAVEYIEARAKLFNRDEFERALNAILDGEPDEQDRL